MMREVVNDNGVLRFKANTVVRELMNRARYGKCDLNDLIGLNLPIADWEEFHQLIGYSLSGYQDISFFSDESKDAAHALQESFRKSGA